MRGLVSGRAAAAAAAGLVDRRGLNRTGGRRGSARPGPLLERLERQRAQRADAFHAVA